MGILLLRALVRIATIERMRIDEETKFEIKFDESPPLPTPMRIIIKRDRELADCDGETLHCPSCGGTEFYCSDITQHHEDGSFSQKFSCYKCTKTEIKTV